MDEIDVEKLIPLIQARPVLWDKTSDIYRNRDATKNAWHEVCSKLSSDFDTVDDREKNVFGKEVIRRWSNIRDSYTKEKRTPKKSASAVRKPKQYVYSNLLRFLDKFYLDRETADGAELKSDGLLENAVGGNKELQASTEHQGVAPTFYRNKKRVLQTKVPKHKKADEVEARCLKVQENIKPCSKMSFLHSLMPYLKKYDEQNFLQFQMGVLKLIENINQRNTQIIAPPPPVYLYQSTTPSHQQYPIQNPTVILQSTPSQSQQFLNSPPSLYSQQLRFSGETTPVISTMPNQPPSSILHQSMSSCSNETNAKQIPQSTTQFSPKKELNISSTDSGDSSIDDNIDFGISD